jgi:hypothetical protein
MDYIENVEVLKQWLKTYKKLTKRVESY